MKPRLLLIASLALLALTPPLRAANDTATAATAINALGIDLLAKTGKPTENALLSPYSIQSALAMTYNGAAGKTRDEMETALHFPKDNTQLNKSFAALNKGLSAAIAKSKAEGPNAEVDLSTANRMFAQKGHQFQQAFFDTLKNDYGASPEQLDFISAPDPARKLINAWVAEQTHKRIEGLIPPDGLTKMTRLVLVNAIYFKATWQDQFENANTHPAPFQIGGTKTVEVPAMTNLQSLGYAKRHGYTVVTLPYGGADIQFVILLPDKPDELPALESKLTPALLAGCANLKPAEVHLWMPKFKLQPATMRLGDALQALGIKLAFSQDADFSGITGDKSLYISDVFHKTYLSLDEHGTEAAAATAVELDAKGIAEPGEPVEVHVDHPFLFAIQDCKTGACLFLGRVTDPRDPR